MRVFVTGATGWIGAAVVDQLLGSGHDVVGLARSDSSADVLATKGARVLRGDLDDPDSIKAGAGDADAVMHLANKHDFTDPARSNRAERSAVATIADALTGSDRPFLLAAGVVALAQGRAATEDDVSPFRGADSVRGGSENLALDAVARGVHAVSLRFAPTVHGAGDHGFIATLVGVARERGVSGYVGEGTNRWPAVHRSDAARLVVLGLEAQAGAVLHAVAEEGVPSRDIAEAIGRGLGVPAASISPEEAPRHFGWIGRFFALDLPTSSERTRAAYGWDPTGPTLLDDLAAGSYFTSS